MERTLQISLPAARVNAKMTQGEVAKAMGVSVTTLIAWEKNRAKIDARVLRKLADLYGITSDDIFLPEVSETN